MIDQAHIRVISRGVPGKTCSAVELLSRVKVVVSPLREEPNVIFPVLLILAGLFMVIAALQMTNVASALALIGVGLGVAALGVWLMRQSKADYSFD